MNRIHEEIRIEAPIEHVWAFLCDATRWHDWDPRTEYSEISGPLDQVGSTFVGAVRVMGFEMKSTMKVIEVEKPRLLRFKSDMGSFAYRFEPEGPVTRMTCEGEFEMPGHVPGFIQKLISKGWMERATRQQLEDFKALAEVEVPVAV
jgi:hypothetical protein